jgi:HK97 family phage major capsid protein
MPTMPTKTDLLDKRSNLRSEIERLANIEHITPGEDQRLDRLIAGFEKVTGQLDAIEATERSARDRRIADVRTKATERAVGYDDFAYVPSRTARDIFEAEARNASEAVDLAMRAIDKLSEHAEPVPELPAILKANPAYAERARALADPDYGAGFLKLAAAGGDASRALLTMTPDERAAFERVARSEARGMSTVDTAGGYGIPLALDPSIVLTNTGISGSIRSVARIVRGISDVWRGITSAGSTASWDAEGAEVSDDSPTLANVDITARTGRVFVPVTDELFDDYASLAEQMRRVLADARDRLEADAFINGNGTTQPAGVLTRISATTNSRVLVNTDGAFSAPDVYKVFGNLPARHRPNATWLMSLDAMNEVRSFGDDKLGNQTVNLQAGYAFNLLGRPVIESASMPDFTGTTGAANITLVGDFENFVIFDRLAGRLELIPHLFGTTNGRPTGQRGWFYSFRVGSEVMNTDAFRVLVNE